MKCSSKMGASQALKWIKNKDALWMKGEVAIVREVWESYRYLVYAQILVFSNIYHEFCMYVKEDEI